MNNADMSQYLDVFLDEGREQLVLLETNILEMERGNHTTEMLQILFRAAHTLKGSSRAMGFLAIGDLTHEMENILDDLRNDKLEVSTAIVNVLLACLDTLGRLVDAVAEAGTDTGAVDDQIPVLVKRLAALRTSETIVAPPEVIPSEGVDNSPLRDFVLLEHEQTAVDAAHNSGLSVYHIGITLNAECLMKSVRVWMAFGALEPLGTVISCDPSEEKLEAEEFDYSFKVAFATESSSEEIIKALTSVSEIESCETYVRPVKSASTGQSEGLAMSETKQDISETVDKPTAGAKASPPQSQTIRVDVSRLDSLLNLVGELVIERSQIHQLCVDLHRRYPRDTEASQLLETTNRIARVTAELQDLIMKARLLPIDGVFQRMPRMVRDLAQKTGKTVRFEMLGGETELDRTVLESLADPLIHLLRNSIDHGVERPEDRIAAGKPIEGLVTLSARHEENRIVIEITDDGKGMDPNVLRDVAIRKGLVTPAGAAAMTDKDALGLIFASGFSTAAVLSDISGRGVGMDIVKSNLEKIGGRVVVESTIGSGSRFTIHLPMTLAIVRAVLVESGGGTYVLPLGNIVEMLRLGSAEEDTEQRTLGGQPVISVRGRTIPLVNLTNLLGRSADSAWTAKIADDSFVVIVGIGTKQIGLCVDALLGEQEVVIKSMGTLLGDIPGLSGATILGDGQVALIVDVMKATERVESADWAKREKALAS